MISGITEISVSGACIVASCNCSPDNWTNTRITIANCTQFRAGISSPLHSIYTTGHYKCATREVKTLGKPSDILPTLSLDLTRNNINYSLAHLNRSFATMLSLINFCWCHRVLWQQCFYFARSTFVGLRGRNSSFEPGAICDGDRYIILGIRGAFGARVVACSLAVIA